MRGFPLLTPVTVIVNSVLPNEVVVDIKVDLLDSVSHVDLVTFRSSKDPSRGPGILLESGEVIQFCYKTKGWKRVNRVEKQLPPYAGRQDPVMFVPAERTICFS